jgi:FkbM family methyltransferase
VIDGVFETEAVPLSTRALLAIARHWPSHLRGLARLRAAIHSSLSGRKPYVRARLRQSRLELLVPWNDSVGSALLTFGDNEPGVYRFLCACFSHSGSRNILVDIGANIGGFALRVAERFPRACVIAFEPNPPIAELLRHNAETSGLASQVDIRVIAAGSTATTALLNVASNDSGNATLRPGTGTDVSVPVRRLDAELSTDEWKRTAVIKVDVEGHELDVFRGATELFKVATPPLIFEVNCPELAARNVTPPDLGAFLRSVGYKNFYGCSDRLYPIANGAYPVGNVVAVGDDSQAILNEFGFDRNFAPRPQRQLPVVQYQL